MFYPVNIGDHFSIEFTHSVNKSLVIEYYRFDKDNNIYVYKTVYYNYGAGVPTNIKNDEILTYGEDGSMIIDNINQKIDNLNYYLSAQYDHILRINDGEAISLWEIFGTKKNIHIEVN